MEAILLSGCGINIKGEVDFNNSVLYYLRFLVSSLSSPFFSVLNNRFADFSTEFNN